MSYAVKEIFYTLQGEGSNTGRPAVFVRFSGCNLWSGLEKDRGTAVCRFCDTDFVGTKGSGGGKFETAAKLARTIRSFWPQTSRTWKPFVVCTGGEPLLQLDQDLVEALHLESFEIAIETNGTIPVPRGIDWVCVSPKANAPIVLNAGHEMKLVFPQRNVDPEQFTALDFSLFYLQPMDGPNRTENTALAIEYCLAHPQWWLSLQAHKLVGLR